jgi:hypothetical protein
MNPPRRVHPFPTPTVNDPPALNPTPTVNTPVSIPDPNSKRSSCIESNTNSKHSIIYDTIPIHTPTGVWIFFENSLANRIKFIIFVLVINLKPDMPCNTLQLTCAAAARQLPLL